MAGCAAQRFEGIGPTVFTCLQEKGAAAGVPLAGNEGQATTMGVTIRWSYEPASEVLVIECLDAPFFVPCSTVASRIKDLVDGCRPQAA